MSSPSASGPTKRPLEDPSSPNVKDEHDSKRPALEKETEEAQEEETKAESPAPVKDEVEEQQQEATTGHEEQVAAKDDDTVVPDAPHPEQEADQHSAPVDETQWIHIRSLITSAEAATVIGKAGENVTQIRKMAEAKCTVSDYQRGAGERILTVSGAVDAVAKVTFQMHFLQHGLPC